MTKTIFLLLSVFFTGNLLAQRPGVDTIEIFSKANQKFIKTVVITPEGYARNKNRYPVLYLLHGYGGSYNNWITRVPALKEYATDFNSIIVCPNGENSWYINSPVAKGSNFETFAGVELVNFIDSSYRTIADRKKRAISGLSMGGHGALMLALRHKETFGAAGSMSGALDLTGIVSKYDISKLIGDTMSFKWRDYSVLHLADSVSTKGLHIIFDCGGNDFLLQANRDLHARLNAQKVPHDYIERPGAHNWPYWSNAITYQLMFFRKFFDQDAPAKTR